MTCADSKIDSTESPCIVKSAVNSLKAKAVSKTAKSVLPAKNSSSGQSAVVDSKADKTIKGSVTSNSASKQAKIGLPTSVKNVEPPPQKSSSTDNVLKKSVASSKPLSEREGIVVDKSRPTAGLQKTVEKVKSSPVKISPVKISPVKISPVKISPVKMAGKPLKQSVKSAVSIVVKKPVDKPRESSQDRPSGGSGGMRAAPQKSGSGGGRSGDDSRHRERGSDSRHDSGGGQSAARRRPDHNDYHHHRNRSGHRAASPRRDSRAASPRRETRPASPRRDAQQDLRWCSLKGTGASPRVSRSGDRRSEDRMPAASHGRETHRQEFLNPSTSRDTPAVGTDTFSFTSDMQFGSSMGNEFLDFGSDYDGRGKKEVTRCFRLLSMQIPLREGAHLLVSLPTLFLISQSDDNKIIMFCIIFAEPCHYIMHILYLIFPENIDQHFLSKLQNFWFCSR